MKILRAITRAIDTMNFTDTLALVRRIALVTLCAMPVLATGAEQQTFATPDEAANALLSALKANDDAALIAIFGDKHRTLIVTPDRAANSETRAKIATAMQMYASSKNRQRSTDTADRRSGVADADSARSHR